MEGNGDVVQRIEGMAARMRRRALEMALGAGAGSSHFGGGLSIMEITATLYGAVMRYDPHNPEWPERDRFILSKGHGVLGYYTALAEAGFVTVDELMTFGKAGTCLVGHPVMNRTKGIEFSNGSLGMGLSLGVGVAVAGKTRKARYKVYVLIGDGECNEGSVWEAAMAASQFKLDNLVAVIDRNKLQQTGPNNRVMSVGDLAGKWRSFGWDAVDVDGHDVAELYHAFRAAGVGGGPTVIVAHTVKGKGASFAEGNNAWHHAVLTKSQYALAMSELGAE